MIAFVFGVAVGFVLALACVAFWTRPSARAPSREHAPTLSGLRQYVVDGLSSILPLGIVADVSEDSLNEVGRVLVRVALRRANRRAS